MVAAQHYGGHISINTTVARTEGTISAPREVPIVKLSAGRVGEGIIFTDPLEQGKASRLKDYSA